MSVLLWVLLLGGLSVSVGDRSPNVLYLDVFLPVWLVFQSYWRGVHPDFRDPTILHLAWACFLAFIISAVSNPLDVLKSIAAIKVYIIGFLFYGISRKLRPSLLILSIWGATVGVLLLYNYFDSWASLLSTTNIVAVKDEVGITLGRSNYVASILLLLLPLSLAGFAAEKRGKRWVCAGCCLVMILGLASTLSRGAIAALVIAILICLPLAFRAGLTYKHVVIGIIAIAVVYIALPSDILDANVALYNVKLANSDPGRVDLMREAWERFQENPVLGVGPGQLPTWVKIDGVENVLSGMNAHNLVLNALAETGLVGSLPLLLLVSVILNRVWRSAWSLRTPLAVALCVSFTAVLLHNMVEASFEGEEFQVVFWTIAALIPVSDVLRAAEPRLSLTPDPLRF